MPLSSYLYTPDRGLMSTKNVYLIPRIKDGVIILLKAYSRLTLGGT
jgi:hypothetical protein